MVEYRRYRLYGGNIWTVLYLHLVLLVYYRRAPTIGVRVSLRGREQRKARMSLLWHLLESTVQNQDRQ